MKAIKKRFFLVKSALFVFVLACLGFSACEDSPIQPEYGVPVVREKSLKIEKQQRDSVINNDQQIIKRESEKNFN
jgi:hypothetical protein